MDVIGEGAQFIVAHADVSGHVEPATGGSMLAPRSGYRPCSYNPKEGSVMVQIRVVYEDFQTRIGRGRSCRRRRRPHMSIPNGCRERIKRKDHGSLGRHTSSTAYSMEC